MVRRATKLRRPDQEKTQVALVDALLGPLRDCKNMAQVPYLREGQGVDDSHLTLIGKLTPLPG